MVDRQAQEKNRGGEGVIKQRKKWYHHIDWDIALKVWDKIYPKKKKKKIREARE